MSKAMNKAESKEFKYDSQEEFLEKLENMMENGISPSDITTLTPFHVHEAEHILKEKTSHLRFFTLTGAITGFILSFAFIIFTVFDWPLITGGKPLVSIPAFIVIAFECTILIGGIVSFIGFLHLSKLPDPRGVIEPRECGNQFVILYHPNKEKNPSDNSRTTPAEVTA